MNNKPVKGALNNKQLLDQLQQMKSKFNHQTKTVKQLRKQRNTDKKKIKSDMRKEYEDERKKCATLQQKLDKSEKKNKVIKSQLLHLKCKKQKHAKQSSNPRIGELRKENYNLKMKLLKETLVTINKEKKWYHRSLKIFKNKQQKWIDKQRAIFKDKKVIIKYVFVDDIKYIKQYKKPHTTKHKNKTKLQFRNRVKFEMKNGGETTKKDVEIIVLDSELTDEQSNKSQARKDEEIDKLMDNLMQEIGESPAEIEEDTKCPINNDDDAYKTNMLYLQKRLGELEKEIQSKDKVIESLRCTHMHVNKMNVNKTNERAVNVSVDNKCKREAVFRDETKSHSQEQLRMNRQFGQLNIKIEQNSNIIKQQVHIESAVKNSQFLLQDAMLKLKKENETLQLQIVRLQQK